MRAIAAFLCTVALAACDGGADPAPRAAASPSSPAPSYSQPPLVEDCDVLCVSAAEVRPGQVIEVTFDPPPRLIWGVFSEVWRIEDDGRPDFVATLYGWRGKDRKLTTFWPGTGGGEDIGFYGPGSWRWRVPGRLEPGTYQIRKEATGPGVRRPIEDRTTTWRVDFEVVS